MVNAIEKGEKPQPTYWFNDAMMKMSEIKQMMRMCPATILANSLIINANGLVKIPSISTGTKMIFTQPFALMIRLFANMVAGHILIICLISLIFIMASLNQYVGWGFSPFSIAFTIFIYFIEVLVAFLQAFIFTILTAVFIGQAFEGGHNDTDHHADAVII